MEWIKEIINLIFNHASNGTVLVVGRYHSNVYYIFMYDSCNVLLLYHSQSYLDCLVLACLRRIQEWSLVSIFMEFRRNTWPQNNFDFEQMIEFFHFNYDEFVSEGNNDTLPDFIMLHKSLKVRAYERSYHNLGNFHSTFFANYYRIYLIG